MLRSIPEHAFIFYSFASILSGLLALALAWVLHRDRSLWGEARWVWLLAGLCSLAGAFSFDSLLSFYRLFYGQNLPLPLDPGSIEFVFLLGAALCFGGGVGRLNLASPALAVILVVGVGGLVDLVLHLSGAGWDHAPLHWLVVSLLFVTWTLLGPDPTFSSGSRKLLRFSCLGFSVSFFFIFLGSLSPDSSFFQVTTLVGDLILAIPLTALARLIEVGAAHLGVQFVIRLNGVFIVLAACVLFLLVGVEKRDYFNSFSRDASNLAEFLNKQAPGFLQRSEESATSFPENPEMGSRIAGEFSHWPALLSLAVGIGELQMVVLRDPSGRTERRIERGPPQADPFSPPVQFLPNQRFRISRPFQAANGAGRAGWLEMTASMSEINRRVSRLILIIFAVFLVLVLISGVPIAMTVAQADNTIRQQHQELERTHEQLLQAARLAAVGEMAGGVAHELNNPLGVILGRASYLKAVVNESAGESFLEDLEVIERNAFRASRIIGDLLDFARPKPLSRSNYDINLVVSETVRFIKPRLDDREIELSVDLSPSVEAFVDPDRLQQVIVNLLNNAIDSCDRHGRIDVATHADVSRDQIVITIADDGAGIPKEHLKKIFDPFYTTKQGGTGLGLSVSYRIVSDHGGQIQATGRAGGGSCFRIILPATPPGEQK